MVSRKTTTGISSRVFFCGAKNSNIIWRAAGEKKNRVQCKNLAFYTTESLNEPFFAEQKRKNGAAGKKIKIWYSLLGPPLDPSHVQNPTEFSDFWWDDGRMMVFGRGGKPFSVG